MSAAFAWAIERVLLEEGDYANDPHDPGAETKWGVARASHPEIPAAAWRDFKRADAVLLYERDYWTPIRGDELPGPIATALFDAAINQGVTVAVRLLQSCLGVGVDGVMGPVTVREARQRDTSILLAEFMAERVLRYASLPGFARYGRGWARRCFRMHRAALMSV